MNKDIELIAVARIIKPFGLRGEVKLHLLADFDDFVKFPEFFVKEKFFLRRLVLASVRGRGDIVLFEGFASRDDAELLKGKTLYVKKEVLPPKNHIDEFYTFELEGMEVIENDEVLGIVEEMVDMNGRWYMQVNGKYDLLIPFLKVFVKKIEFENKKIFVELPEGFKELNRKE